jgi:hypothetical protein
MKNNTEIDYRKGIKAKFEKERRGDFHPFLNTPKPALLRELCLLKFDNGLNKVDETIFRIYFRVSETEDLRAAIFNYHIPYFKSVGNFLTAKAADKVTNMNNLNLIAVLVDFNPRPFNKFHRSNLLEENHDANDSPINEVDTIEISTGKSETMTERKEYVFVPKNNFKKKLGYGVLGVLGLFTVGYTSKDLLFPEKQCMQWMGDHYEMVDCLEGVQGIGSYQKAQPFDPIEFERKELVVCDTTEFFVDGNREKPKVWYDKEKDGLHYFTMDGLNPETNDHLKPITDYMIGKYVEPCK